jgi:hypothetical protein
MTEEGRCYVCGGWLAKTWALGQTPDGAVRVHTVCKPYVETAYQQRAEQQIYDGWKGD